MSSTGNTKRKKDPCQYTPFRLEEIPTKKRETNSRRRTGTKEQSNKLHLKLNLRIIVEVKVTEWQVKSKRNYI